MCVCVCVCVRVSACVHGCVCVHRSCQLKLSSENINLNVKQNNYRRERWFCTPLLHRRISLLACCNFLLLREGTYGGIQMRYCIISHALFSNVLVTNVFSLESVTKDEQVDTLVDKRVGVAPTAGSFQAPHLEGKEGRGIASGSSAKVRGSEGLVALGFELFCVVKPALGSHIALVSVPKDDINVSRLHIVYLLHFPEANVRQSNARRP